jgi:hypothetical protein
MSIKTMAAKITAERKLKHGMARLLKAVAEMPSECRIVEDLPTPTIHQYSVIWSLVDPDPANWN